MADLRRHLNAFRIPGTLLAVALLGLIAPATVASAAAPKDGERTFSVLAVGGQRLPEGIHYLRSADEGLPVKVSTSRRSELQAAPAAGQPLVFGLKRASASPAGPAFEPLCSVVWPSGDVSRALVLLTVDGGKLHAVAIDDGENVFPRASLRVINLTGRPLLGRWGEFQGELAPGLITAKPFPKVAPTSAGLPGRFQVGLGVRQADGNAKIIFAGWTEAWPDARTLLLIGSTGEADNPRFRTRWIVESLPEKKAE